MRKKVSGNLMLDRRIGERIVIGQGAGMIVLEVVDIERYGASARVKIGVVCDKSIPVFRSELVTDGVDAGRDPRQSSETVTPSDLDS